jgi:hypothetical protein
MSDGKMLWLWRDGEGKYLAFDDLFPTLPGSDDPATLGQPCGYATLRILTLEEAQRVSREEFRRRYGERKLDGVPIPPTDGASPDKAKVRRPE